MSKNSLKNEEIAAMTQDGGNSTPGSAQEQIAKLLAVKLGKEIKEEQEAAEQAQRFREAHISAVKQTMEQQAAQQENCPHMKPNFRPAIGGQKDHKGNHHFICQYCGKEYGNELPYHLRIPAEMVGGPQ